MPRSRLSFAADSAAPVAGPLRILFRALAQAALASTLGAACENSEPQDDGDEGARAHDAGTDAAPTPSDAGADAALEPGFSPIACTGSQTELPGALKTARPTSYLGAFRGYIYQRSPQAGSDGGVSAVDGTIEIVHQGEACAGLAAPAPCQAQLASLQAATSCPCSPFFVVEEAGVLTRLTERADLLALLGPVDAPADAVLLALLDGKTVCSGFGGVSVPGPSIKALGTGYEIHSTYESCGAGKFRDKIGIAADGTVTLIEHAMYAPSQCAIGRRPDGLYAASPTQRATRRGAYLAEAAHLEAASVFAFEKLGRELRALGAPAALIDAVHEAQQDEVRHARDVTALARAHGVEPAPPRVQDTALRSPLALALDNVAEGCVRETFGALLATYQAEAAQDRALRVAMQSIAEDETRHAALSWQLQAWLEPQLSAHERAQVEATRLAALANLHNELGSSLPRADRAALGLPGSAVASALLADLTRALPVTLSART